MFASVRSRLAGTCLRRWLLTLLIAGSPLTAHAGSNAMLEGAVDPSMAQRVNDAISAGEKIVTLDSEWHDSGGKLVSGGNSDLGWFLGELLWRSHVKVRCTGLCFSSAAHILIASRGCIVSRRGRVALHVPVLQGPMDVTTYARRRSEAVDQWRLRMSLHKVPLDIVDRALWDRDGLHELSAYEMKRIGCEVE